MDPLENETPEGELVGARLRFDTEAEALQFALGFGTDVELLGPGRTVPSPARSRLGHAYGIWMNQAHRQAGRSSAIITATWRLVVLLSV